MIDMVVQIIFQNNYIYIQTMEDYVGVVNVDQINLNRQSLYGLYYVTRDGFGQLTQIYKYGTFVQVFREYNKIIGTHQEEEEEEEEEGNEEDEDLPYNLIFFELGDGQRPLHFINKVRLSATEASQLGMSEVSAGNRIQVVFSDMTIIQDLTLPSPDLSEFENQSNRL